MTKYYLAEYRYSGNLAEFEGKKSGKSYKANRDTFRELHGMLWLPKSNRVVITSDRFVTTDKGEAVDWLVKQAENKIRLLTEQIERQHKPEIRSLEALR